MNVPAVPTALASTVTAVDRPRRQVAVAEKLP